MLQTGYTAALLFLLIFIESTPVDFSHWAGIEECLSELELTGNKFTKIDGKKLKKFKNIKKLTITETSITKLPKEIGELKNLTELVVSKNKIKKLPDKIKFLTQLTVLDLNTNDFETFPLQVLELHSLLSLDVSSNGFSELPIDFHKKLPELRVLILSDNPLNKLPDVIFSLSNLRQLYLYNTNLQDVPEKISTLTSLTVLNFGKNSLKILPDGMVSLNDLQILNLESNCFEQLPEYFKLFKNLKSVVVTDNKLVDFPICLCSCVSLEVLKLNNNVISLIPSEIKKLKNLKEFNIDNNNLTEIPFELLYCTGLKKLSAAKNKIEKLPDIQSILPEKKKENDFLLKSIVFVNLACNKLSEFPGFILTSSMLKQIKLESNRIVCIPDEIAKLKSLDQLILDNNELKEISESLQHCSRLKMLSVNQNQIKCIPDVICKLKLLEHLAAGNNLIQYLPVCFCELINLKYIDFSNNQLTSLPQGWCNLNKLHELSLKMNYLVTVPSEFSKLPNLKILWLFDNYISEIPIEFKDLQNTLELLDLNDNPMNLHSTNTSLGRNKLVKMFPFKVRIFNPNYSRRFIPVTEQEVIEKMKQQKHYWNVEELKKLVSFSIPPHRHSFDEIKKKWENIKEYITVKETVDKMEEYIKDLYAVPPNYKKLYVNTENDIHMLKNLLEAVMVCMEKLVENKKISKKDLKDIISSNFNVIVKKVALCASGKIEELNAVYKIMINDFTERIGTVESFVDDFMIQTKLDTFNNLIGELGGEQNVHLKDFWEFRVRKNLGFGTNYRSSYGSLEQDPWRAHTGNFLDCFYRRFTVGIVVESLTRAINNNNEIKNLFLSYLNELKDLTLVEKMQMVECETQDELENATGVKPKAVLTYLIDRRLVLTR